jgi:hypothetical protein
MIINVDTNENSARHLFDCLYAYYQSLEPDYITDRVIKFNHYDKSNNINILLAEMPLQEKDYSCYDLVLFCNGLEYFGIGTDTIRDNLSRPNAYLLTQSRVTDDHPHRSKFIWMPGAILLPYPRVMNFSYF